MTLAEKACALDSRQARQPDVEEGHGRQVSRGGEGAQCRFHRPERADAAEPIRAVQEQHETVADLALILHHDDRDHRRLDGRQRTAGVAGRSYRVPSFQAKGIRHSKVVPAPGAETTPRLPPRRSARRFMLVSPVPFETIL